MNVFRSIKRRLGSRRDVAIEVDADLEAPDGRMVVARLTEDGAWYLLPMSPAAARQLAVNLLVIALAADPAGHVELTDAELGRCAAQAYERRGAPIIFKEN